MRTYPFVYSALIKQMFLSLWILLVLLAAASERHKTLQYSSFCKNKLNSPFETTKRPCSDKLTDQILYQT